MPDRRRSGDVVLAAYAASVLFCGGVCGDLCVALCEYRTVQVAAVDGGEEGEAVIEKRRSKAPFLHDKARNSRRKCDLGSPRDWRNIADATQRRCIGRLIFRHPAAQVATHFIVA